MLAELWPAWRPEWILYEDDDLVILDKPAGTPTHAPEKDRVDDAHSRVLAFMDERGDRDPYLGIHQRLDAATSGVLLFTRRKQANRAIAEQFEGRRVAKTYVAGVTGWRSKGGAGKLEHHLVADRDGTMRVLPAGRPGGQVAVTRWKVLERGAGAGAGRALLELCPETGRTHQLRVQLQAVGSPIAGDTLYGGPPAPRLLLHATELRLSHPTSKDELIVRSPVPERFGAWLRGEDDAPRTVEAMEVVMREAAGRRFGLSRLAGTDAFRILNDAGDGLPGVAIDRYGDHLVVGLSGEEAERSRDVTLDAAARLGAAGVYLKVRPKHASVVVDTRREELAPREAVRGESAPESFTVHELGLAYEVRLGDGLSTGIFLDQRENRRRARELAGGARVLNLFAYTGAFTVAALAGGARSSVTVDVSRGALTWAARNLAAAGADVLAHELVEADALVWLERPAAKKGERFDLVLLDPPSFATTKQTRFSAESDYKKLAALAIAVLAPGGRLLACTNHRGIVRAKFRRYLHEAVRMAGRTAVQMKDLPDPVDFPPAPGLEPHLKSLLVTVE